MHEELVMETKLRVVVEVFLVSLFIVGTMGCAVKRTKFSDPQMRIAIDATNLDTYNYYAIQKELVDTGRFVVVDRGKGFETIKHEQVDENKTDRFEVSGRYAEYGKLHGIGSVVTPAGRCVLSPRMFSEDYECRLTLTLIHTVTGEVTAVASSVERSPDGKTVSWESVSERLVDNYPKYFEKFEKTERLLEYERGLVEQHDKAVLEEINKIIEAE